MAASTSSMAALSAYRNILRATRVAFRGDQRILVSAREQVRASYLKDRTLAAGSAEASERIQHAEEVARFLRQNVVQGEKLETGAGAGAGPHGQQEEQGDRYRLNIHEETERGDNEANRMPKEEMGSLGGARAKRFKKT